MKRVTGIGGVFFKANDPEKLYAWYERHLGIARNPHGVVVFRDAGGEKTVWTIFPRDTTYFAPSTQPFMINYRVDDLDALLAALREEGVEIDPRRDDSAFGKFASVIDPEGNRIELWEPPR